MGGQEETKLRVGIVGAGVGGLVLAQLLRNDPKIDLKIYERAASEEDVGQLAGFRILLGSDVLSTLRSRLPQKTAIALEDAVGMSGSEGQRLYLMDAMGKRLLTVSNREYTNSSSVSRWKLRKALLTNLDEVIQFGREYEYYQRTTRGVKVFFTDGSEDECDVLVGADGAGSRVRKQLLPSSTREALGVTVIYFKMPLTVDTEKLIPFGVGGMAIPPRSSFIISSYKDQNQPYGRFDLERIGPEESFLMCGLGCYTNEFLNQSKHPDSMTPEELKEECLRRSEKWHPAFRKLISLAIPDSVFVAHIKTQNPIKAWQKGSRVTLLGDAAHSMTPYLGKGATAAILDALALAQHLKKGTFATAVEMDEQLHKYEVDMLQRGFRFVKASMRVHQLVFDWGPDDRFAKWRNRVIKLCDLALRVMSGNFWVTVSIMLRRWMETIFILCAFIV